MSSEYGKLRPTNGWDLLASLGHPSKFKQVSCLGSVTARHSSSGCQPNFAVFNRGRHVSSAGRPSRWALAHILVSVCGLLTEGRINRMTKSLEMRVFLLTLSGDSDMGDTATLCVVGTVGRTFVGLLTDCWGVWVFSDLISLAHLSKHKMCSAGLAFALLLCYLRDFHYLHLYSPNR